MKRPLIVAGALIALLAAPAYAQQTPAAPQTELEKAGLVPPTVMSEGYQTHSDDRLTSRIVGQQVYSSAGTDAETIGKIGDLVITPQGQISAAVIEVGGFLGVGEKLVAVNYSDLLWVKASDGTSRFVMTTTAEALKAAPAFIWADSEEVTGAAMTPAEEADQMVQGDPNAVASDPDATTDQPDVVAAPIDRTTLTDVDGTTLTPDQLAGTAVYGIDSQIGTISDVIMDADGKVDALIVDVGGFLGIGAKPVAVGFEGLKFSTDVNDTRYLFLNATKEQLEAQTAFDPATYEADRTNQRMVIAP